MTDQQDTDATAYTADVGSGLASSGLGLILAGPDGALAGAFVGPLVARAVRQGMQQLLGWLTGRQTERVKTAITTAADEIARRLEAGESVRDDHFFSAGDNGQSSASEVAEGVLQHAAGAYEQYKTAHFGHLLASIAFRPDIGVADAHYLTRLADRLSWRQFLVLALFREPPQESLSLREIDQSGVGLSGSVTGLSEEVQELGNLGLLGEADADGDAIRAGTLIRGASGLIGVPMELWRLTALGRLLVETARLDLLPSEARNKVLDDLLAQPRNTS